MSATADRDQSPPPATVAEHNDLVHRNADVPEDAAPPLPPFEPLFTLLTNATTNATVHPRVHYIFSDDDPSVLAAAAATTADPSHRALVVDLAAAPPGDPGRWAVSWASSMSPSFAVTGSSVAVQQNEGDDTAEDDRRGGAALMLRVKGVEHEPIDMRPDSLPSSGSGTSLGREDVEGLAEDFRRRMGVLKNVVDEGEKRRAVLGHQQQQDEDQDTPEMAVVEDDDVKEKPSAGD
ncbi:hypothetical protein B0J13DRAFT_521532 [Dactylonectria estremocensis]|uniref:Uncharacterized protein n=1 Tax=Dactylonectria estremocensis TaxID=1079267 RepID=A0A9P9F7K3_9HYPO|nr:hypothetical protein B0J13DRAFT_521532 [Dactylonectria estremocensis]